MSIGYERLVDEKAFVHEVTGGDKPKENARGLVRSIEVMVGRYGRLSVQFGSPVSLADVLRDLDARSKPEHLTTMSPARRRAVVTRLAYRVMNEINAVTAVTPGSLVATALLTHDRRGLPERDLFLACERLARTLRRFGARFSPSLAVADSACRARCARRWTSFVRAEHVAAHSVGDDVIYVVPPEARMSLDLAKNVIIHFFVPRALIATALLASPGPPLGADMRARSRPRAVAPLQVRVHLPGRRAPSSASSKKRSPLMVADSELARVVRAPNDSGDALVPQGEDGREQIELYARLLENFVEGYRVAARGLAALLRGPLAVKDVVKRAITAGETHVSCGRDRASRGGEPTDDRERLRELRRSGVRLAERRKDRPCRVVRVPDGGGHDRGARCRDGRSAPPWRRAGAPHVRDA